MTTAQHDQYRLSDPRLVIHGSPVDPIGPCVPLYSEEFAADPHKVYREMRQRFGSLAPVELAPGVPATLVIGYHTALRILNDPEHFPADPREWQRGVPEDCPVLPMMEYRPNPLRTVGQERIRYRSAAVSAIGEIDMHELRTTIEQIAVTLINSFCADGYCDVVGQYASPLIFATLNAMLGCPPELGHRAARGLAAMFDTVDAAEGNATQADALLELARLRRVQPGDDITTRLVRHPVQLSDEETRQQLALLYGAGTEPPQNLIANTLLLMLTDERFAANVLDGSLSTRDALDEVLFNDPPLSNYCISYPRQPMLIDRIWLPAHQPVLISMTACNNDPAIKADGPTLNRSHLAFSAGQHSCPARSVALLIVQDAIDQLLDAVPEMELAVPRADLRWRPGPFHRALVSLPVTFPESPPIRVNGD
ncbi:cytochrome P450 [Nocardia zapadnayensis]|uniref:cytochrome P450 n=1 Tax=Nocardia rhamnosiphila TaxID=426716 RepID=UPI002246B7A0|nr:cytochrome P450 [Nocardia zapadnayensis]MCX0272375.1 cytochrome P450 [Nocardia zapadnayensis]